MHRDILYKISDFSFTYPFSSHKISILGDILISRGEVVLVTGKSGAGKSTLLYALKGLFPEIIKGKLSGKLWFNQQLIQDISVQERLKIGVVFQNPSHQIINRLVMDELAFGLENLGLSREVIVDKIISFSHKYRVNHLLDRYIGTLSGGERQRIILLSIILTNPEVLLLDEPTAFLDPNSAWLFMDLVHQVSKNKTIIIVEHNICYVKDMLTRVLVIDEYGVIQEGLDSDILDEKLCMMNSSIKDNSFLDPILEVKNLTFAYKRAEVIFSNLSFILNKAECLGIMGASGIGKSTLLKLIMGFEKFCDGEIKLNGVNINNISKKSLYSYVGLLFQNPENHFLYDSVEEELDYDEESIGFFDLYEVRHQNPFTLSEGQKRRLSLGILCVKQSCEVYLLDEPSFGQDYANKIKLIELIKNLQNCGASFIIVSHDEMFIKSLCDRVINLTFKKTENHSIIK